MPEPTREILEIHSMLNVDHIKQHFLTNREWKRIFQKYYPGEIDVDKYVENAWEIFKKNGYRYEVERYSNRPESRSYTAVKSIDLFKGEADEDFIVGRTMVNAHYAVEQLIIMVIDDFEVDFSTFN